MSRLLTSMRHSVHEVVPIQPCEDCEEPATLVLIDAYNGALTTSFYCNEHNPL